MEFKVVLEGTNLTAAQTKRVREAIEGAALREITALDLRGDRGAAILRLPNGGTQGIMARILSAAESKRLFGR